MLPILYEYDETSFTTNGIYRLTDCISCTVTEERNGIYECDFEYPVSGAYYNEITCGRIIAVTHDDTGEIQPFDIVSCSRPISGVVSFHAVHISYRQTEMVVSGTGINSLADAFTLLADATPSNPFSYETDKTSTGYLASADGIPRTVRQILGGVDGSILDAYGGEYEWDCWTVRLWSARGEEKDFVIRYGLNLSDYNEEIDYSETFSSVVPFWKKEENGVTTVVQGDRVDSGFELYSGRNACIPLDLTDKFETRPSTSSLESTASTYMTNNEVNIPSQNISVDFVRLEESEEFSTYSELLQCNLCDSVRIVFPMYDMVGTFKIVKTVYNVLKGRYDSMELGTLSTSLSSALGVVAPQSGDGNSTTNFIPNHYTENIVIPTIVSSDSYIPDGHVANGFTSDGTYFYIASHVSDTDPVYITKVNMSSAEIEEQVETSLTGHGNGLSVYDGELFVADSTNFKVDVLDLSNNYAFLGTFTLNPHCNAVWAGTLNDVQYIIGNEWNNKCVSVYEIEDNYLYPMQRVALKSSPNQYVQGLDCTYNCLYISFSYGTVKRDLQQLPTIIAYAWDGTELNRIYVDLIEYAGTSQYEVEDIYRDSDNNLIYFVTGSGHIYSVATSYFTTSESHHQFSGYSFRHNPFFRMVGGPNVNPTATYSDGLMTSMPMTTGSTYAQGMFTGTGLVAGNSAFFYTRDNDLVGYAVNTNPSTSILYACVEYIIGDDAITYSRGYVAKLSSGTVTVTDLAEWSASNTSYYTTINELNHMPYDLYPLADLVQLP